MAENRELELYEAQAEVDERRLELDAAMRASSAATQDLADHPGDAGARQRIAEQAQQREAQAREALDLAEQRLSDCTPPIERVFAPSPVPPAPPPELTVDDLVAEAHGRAEALVTRRRLELDEAHAAVGQAEQACASSPEDDDLCTAPAEARRQVADRESALHAAESHRDLLAEKFESARADGRLARLAEIERAIGPANSDVAILAFEARGRKLAELAAALLADVKEFGVEHDRLKQDADGIAQQLGIRFAPAMVSAWHAMHRAGEAFRSEAMARRLAAFEIRQLTGV